MGINRSRGSALRRTRLARARVSRVAELQRAASLGIGGRGCVDPLVGVDVKTGPVVVLLFPRLEVVVAQADVQGQVLGDLEIILEVSGIPELIGCAVQRRD